MAEFTDWPCGKERSRMTRLSVDSFFSVVFKGDRNMGSVKGDLRKGPSTAANESSFCKYESMLWAKAVAPVWFLGMNFGVGGLPFRFMGHPNKIRSQI